MLRRASAYIVLIASYGLTWLVASLGRCAGRGRWKPTGRILVIGTFHNPNWYLSHVTPLSRCGLREVILVTDEPQAPLESVRFVCPPRWAVRLLTRAGAKALWLLGAGLRWRADLYMGYHILPGACSALIVARLLGRPACYQMTGGPVELLGGGAHHDGWPWNSIGRPSALLEKLALAVTRQFDLVVVRGCEARQFLRRRGLDGRAAVITGSIRPRPVQASAQRDIDLICCGRLAPVKQPWQFLEVLAEVRRRLPGVRGAVVGDGPLLEGLRRQAAELGLGGSIEFLGKRNDVEALLSRAKVFLLTSRSEGLSIAMAEAMAAGAVPVVADVGELRELVQHGVSGYLVSPDRIDEYASRAVCLLEDEPLRQRLSRSAAEVAGARCGVEAVAKCWQHHLRELMSRTERCHVGMPLRSASSRS